MQQTAGRNLASFGMGFFSDGTGRADKNQLLNKKHSPKSISAIFWEKGVFLEFFRRLTYINWVFLLPFIKEEESNITPASFKLMDGSRFRQMAFKRPHPIYIRDHESNKKLMLQNVFQTSHQLQGMALWPSHEIYPFSRQTPPVEKKR